MSGRRRPKGIPTNDLAVTFSHCISLSAELSSGRKMSTKEESALREKLRGQFAVATSTGLTRTNNRFMKRS